MNTNDILVLFGTSWGSSLHFLQFECQWWSLCKILDVYRCKQNSTFDQKWCLTLTRLNKDNQQRQYKSHCLGFLNTIRNPGINTKKFDISSNINNDSGEILILNLRSLPVLVCRTECSHIFLKLFHFPKSVLHIIHSSCIQ